VTVEIKYNFDTSSDYTFDPTVVEVTGGEARLKLANQADQTFTQDFSSDTGFTYDPTKVEFSGGQVQQKNQIPTDATFGATYTSSINASWGIPVLTPQSTLNNPQVSGGKLDLVSNKNVIYAIGGSYTPQVGAIKFKVTPNYSGSPANGQQFFYINNTDAGGVPDRTYVQHTPSGTLSLEGTDSSGASIGNHSFGNWSAVASQEYEFEINWDYLTGAQRLFIDGNLFGTPDTNVRTRTALPSGSDFRIGGVASSNYLIDDVVLFNAVQHTSNYTPGYTLPEQEYAETSVTLPTFNYTGIGAIQIFQSVAQTASGNGKWVLNGRYHNGGNWVVSDSSYAQANTEAEINNNIGSSQVSNSIIMTLVFPDSETLNSVSNFDLTYTGQYYQSGSTILPNTAIPVTAMSEFVEEITVPANTAVKYSIEINAVQYWWNGGSWQASSGVAETNDAATINDNASELPIAATGDFIRPKVFFITDGLGTPAVQSLCLKVTYDVNPIDRPDGTIIFGSLRDMVGDEMVGTATLRIVNDDQFFIGGNSIQPGEKSKAANDEGIAAIIGVVKTASIDYKYSFFIDYIDKNGKQQTKSLGKSVAPDDTATNIANLTFE